MDNFLTAMNSCIIHCLFISSDNQAIGEIVNDKILIRCVFSHSPEKYYPLNYSVTYQKLSGNRSISDGLRITFGILFPSLVLGYFNELNTGIVCSVGALCVSVTDIPGPVHHRYNGMWVCILLTGAVSLLISYFQTNPALLMCLIAIFY